MNMYEFSLRKLSPILLPRCKTQLWGMITTTNLTNLEHVTRGTWQSNTVLCNSVIVFSWLCHFLAM